MQIGVKRVEDSELPELKQTLLSEKLPTHTIDKNEVIYYKAVDVDDNAIGWGGIEVYGNQGALRTIYIKEEMRGKGAGLLLVQALIEEAREMNLKKLWLLTPKEEKFFQKLGFVYAIRSEAPKDIQNCEEFTWVKNTGSHCMNKTIKQIKEPK